MKMMLLMTGTVDFPAVSPAGCISCLCLLTSLTHLCVYCSHADMTHPFPHTIKCTLFFMKKKKSENRKEHLKQMSFDFIDDMFLMLPGEMSR